MEKNYPRTSTDEHGLVEEVKKKREFSGLPDSVVLRALEESKDDVKGARALLRKYFGVFLTNKILKGKGDLLKMHMSSRKRDYGEFYGRIFETVGLVGSVVDLGCGVNGFSFPFLHEEYGVGEYYGVEASGQLVDKMNEFFDEKGYGEIANAVWMDLFKVGEVVKMLKKCGKPRVVFMFQVVDALENLERDFSKKFISRIAEECEWIVLSLPTESLGGRKKFAVRRKWMLDFLEREFDVVEDFVLSGERIIVVRKS